MVGLELYELPLFFALQGVVLYAVLAGADFGAGIWQLLAGRGEQGKPGLSVREAAAPDNVPTLLVISILAGGLILFPSLALLFRLVLRGAFQAEPVFERGAPLAGPSSGLAATLTATRLAGACFAVGAIFLVVGDSAWPHAIGIAALGAFIVLGLSALAGEDSRE